MITKIIIFIGVLLYSTSVIAQHTIVLPVEDHPAPVSVIEDEIVYYKDVNNIYDKFIDQWKYTDPNNSTTYLQINVLENVYDQSLGDSYYDEIYLEFKYVENGQVIYDSDNYTQEQLKLKIVGSAINTNKCSFYYGEPTDLSVIHKNTREHAIPTLYLEYQELLSMPTGGITEQLHWEVKFVIGENEAWPFKIPNDIVLTRI